MIYSIITLKETIFKIIDQSYSGPFPVAGCQPPTSNFGLPLSDGQDSKKARGSNLIKPHKKEKNSNGHVHGDCDDI